jgi:hypothetical protein
MGKLRELAKEIGTLDLSAASEEQDPELPSYSEEGKILVEVLTVGLDTSKGGYPYEAEVHYHDGSTYWINEGMGFDYWFFEHIEFPRSGWYMITGITGTYIRGDWGFTDDDEDWEFGEVREATQQEIEELGP